MDGIPILHAMFSKFVWKFVRIFRLAITDDGFILGWDLENDSYSKSNSIALDTSLL